MGQCLYCGSTVDDQPFCITCQRPPTADPQSWEGKDIGSHQIIRALGAGPIGMVFEATHGPSAEQVRLKIIDIEIADLKPSLVERASQLAIAATGLHPSLPQIFEESMGTASTRLISVGWVPGRPLQELFEQGPMEVEEACRIVMGLLEALDALHSTGLTHRDIKPENVLITPEGSASPIHLLDVGPSLISAEARKGAHYRSPEQARNDELIGPGTDIYSCGAILYEALAGRRPFQSNDYDVLMSQIAIRRPPALDQLRPDLPAALVQVVTRAMETSPSDRFRSAVEMSKALHTAWEISSAERRIPASVAAAALAVASSPPPPLPAAASPMSQDQEPLTEAELDEMPTGVHPSVLPREVLVDETSGTPGPSPTFKAAAILFLIVALVVGCAMIYFTFMSGGDQPLPQETSQPEATLEPSKTPQKSRGRVKIKLNGLPSGSIWYVDGRRLTANPFQAPKGALTHIIRVEAPGHEPFETNISFSVDQDIAVEMTEIEGAEVPGQFKAYTSGPGANSHRRGPSGGGAAPAPPPAFADDNAPAQLRNRQESVP